MITRTRKGIAGTMAAAGLVVALAACSGSPAPAPTPPLVADLIARHPGCAGHAEQLTDGGVSCAVEGRLYLLYAYGDAAAADRAAVSLRTLHPAGQVDVDGPRVWVTE